MLLPPRTALATARNSRTSALIATFFTLAAIVFLILVLIGSTRADRVLGDIYFLRIDVSHIVPRSVPKAELVDSIARTLGLSDYYQVGLWGYCQGDVGKNVEECATPRAMYAFDPVQILVSQLLAGAEIAVPPNIYHALSMARSVSHWMFACFLVGISLSFLSLIAILINLNSHHILPLLVALIAGVATLFTTIAAVIATALFCVFRRVFEDRPDLNIHSQLGAKMFAFVWVAVATSAAAFSTTWAACCAHRGWGRRGGSSKGKKSWQKTIEVEGGESRVSGETVVVEEAPARLGSSGANTAVSSQAVVGEKPPLENALEEEREDEESEKLPAQQPERPERGRFAERFSVPAPERFSAMGTPYAV